jgi:predicted ATPase/class 3 adenylate cyclase
MERVSTYLPMDRRHALAANRPLPDRAEGAALFADVVGFTHLTDTLVATLGPRRGAEELVRLLNAVHDALIAQVHRYGGSVVGFSGDGFTCWFDDPSPSSGQAGLRAVACGLALQEASASFVSVLTPTGEAVSLALKVAVTAGPARRFVVGDPGIQRLDVLAGATLDRMAQVEEVARQGEVVVGPEVAQQLGERLVVAGWRAGFGVVASLTVEVPPAPWPELDAAALSVEAVRPYLLRPVYERLLAGQASPACPARAARRVSKRSRGEAERRGEFLAELRPAVALFQRFGGLDYDGDEQAGARLDAYVCWVQGVLGRYGGYLLQLTSGEKGNYLYASFGALTVHEDDAERAVAAALELQRRPAELGWVTGVQIGLSRGRVRAGAYGSRTRRTYGAQGDEVNVAARLMQAAPPGEVRCSQRIYEAAKGDWVFEALLPVEVKGKTEPLPVYRPLRRRGERGARLAGALVGRQAEMATLARLLAEAVSGWRRVLLLEGEAGIGKSRLVAELARLARERNVAWLEGAGQSIEQGTPYRAWRDLLAGYFGLEAQMEPAEQQRRVRERVAGVNPALAERAPLLNDVLRLDLPETDLTQGFDPKLRRESLTWLVVDLLRAATSPPSIPPPSGGEERGGLVLVLEDAHWLDSLSWELALSVGRALYDRPLLLVLALRPLDIGYWILDMEPPAPNTQYPIPYAALAGLEGAETVCLEAMPPDETVALAAARLGLPAEALPAELADLVRERAGGNPFFAEELAHALRDSGALVVEEGACTLAADLVALREQVPDTVEGVVLSRIDRLPPEEQLTLKVAAVVGRSFLYRTVRDVHPRQVVEDLLRAHLDDLARRDLTPLEALEPELTYLFKHVITQQVAYDTLLFARRRELHRAVAGWYERGYAGNLSPYYSLLVHHWRGAEDVAQERRYAKLAGEQAAAQYANAEAVAYLSRALALTPEDDLDDRYALLLARERVYYLQGARAAQSQDLHALGKLVDALDDNRLWAEVALRRTDYALAIGDLAAAAEAAQEIIHLAQAVQDAHLEAAGHRHWGRSLWYQGDFPAARVQLEAALAFARDASRRPLEAQSLRDLGIVSAQQEDYVSAQAYFKQSLLLCREIGDRQTEGQALNNLGNLARIQGDHVQAAAYLAQALRVMREIGYRLGQASTLVNLGLVHSERDDHTAARTHFGQALDICHEIVYPSGECIALKGLGKVSLCLGDYAAARTYLERVLSISRETGDRRREAEALASLGRLSHHLGHDEAALEYIQQALLVNQDLGSCALQSGILTSLGQTQVGLGRLAEAAAAYRQALALQRTLKNETWAMEPLAGLAYVALAQGDLPQAQVLVEEILDYVGANTLDGADERLRVYLTCYQVLHAAQDSRAEAVLSTTYTLLQEQAAKIEEEALRRSFLENVAVNREIVAAYQARPEAQ